MQPDVVVPYNWHKRPKHNAKLDASSLHPESTENSRICGDIMSSTGQRGNTQPVEFPTSNTQYKLNSHITLNAFYRTDARAHVHKGGEPVKQQVELVFSVVSPV